MKPMLILILFIGLLGSSSDHNQLLVHGWRRTDSGFVVPDPQDLNTTAMNNPMNMLNSVTVEALNNGTDVKIFREGSQVIVRRYWYPYLLIEVQEQSPATTESTTPAPTPTDASTQTITIRTASQMTTPVESLPSQSSTAPYSSPAGPSATHTISTTVTQEATTTATTATQEPTKITSALTPKATPDLENALSVAFITLATLIEEQLDFIFQLKYGKRYSHCRVNSFQKGSIKVNSTLFFIDTIPNNIDIENTLVSAWESNTTSLLLINGTVFAGQDSTASSSMGKVLYSALTLLLTCVLLVLQTLS
ncbi:hypothetical protein HF521_015424 [Silurus meridionalis]|uniref:SEA domain-containing protein n=1 Tax=Silurus meridionalis TaxID=175797 RepID=A0A8T0A9B5_SILME|nr:hypothetical protein HF521_015424 [Silurus meridionalis]